MKSTIIIPTYNEKENIKPLIQAIFNLGINNLGILIIDDNSPDQTAQAVKAIQNQYPDKLHLIVRSGKLGLGSAYVTGFKWALANNADLAFEMDADGSHNPQDVPRMIQTITNGPAQIVIGSRRIPGGKISGWNFFRHLSSWGAMTVARIFLGLKTYDVTSGFRCYKTEVLKQIDLDQIKSNGYAFQEEMVYLIEKKGFAIKEIPVTFKDRQLGQSKLSIKDIVEFFVTMLRLKLTKFN